MITASPGPSFLRWQSASGPSTLGLELLGEPVGLDGLSVALDAIGRAPRGLDAAFMILRVVSRAADLAHAARRAATCQGPTRICLAVGSGGVAGIGVIDAFMAASADRVGLLVDAVNEHTPPAVLVHGAIEAIRLEAGFVYRAAHDARLACALEAMLELAHNCGLATLGPASAPNDEWLLPGVTFDYVPSYVVEAERRNAPMLPGRPVREASSLDFQASC